jgi:hypothetical protein
LVVDPNAVRTRKFVMKFLSSILRWNSHIGWQLNGVDDEQFP